MSDIKCTYFEYALLNKTRNLGAQDARMTGRYVACPRHLYGVGCVLLAGKRVQLFRTILFI